MFRGERPASGDLQRGVPFVPQSELTRAATSETAAKCEGERKQVGNQREPSIGGFCAMEIPPSCNYARLAAFRSSDAMYTTLI